MELYTILSVLAVFVASVDCRLQCHPVDPCKEEMKVGPCKAAFNRYYFNIATQQCELFSWGGCQPNGNNFETIEECQQICPVKKSPCNEEQKVGPCKAAFNRFYFNAESQQCEFFSWGGCQPNGNNFETIEECQQICPVKKSPCEEEQKVGPCRGAFNRFYFNSESEQCEYFSWGGCAPNGNNFETIQECESTCPIAHKNPCYEKVKSGPCKAAFSRYYFDSESRQCRVFTFGNCAPNGNNFNSVEECENTCQAGRDPCLEPAETGTCEASISRYYFNPMLRKCLTFTWGGCNPNENNFETEDDCRSSCVRQFWMP